MSDVSKDRAADLAHFRTTVQGRESILARLHRWICHPLPASCSRGAQAAPGGALLPAQTGTGRLGRRFERALILKLVFGSLLLVGLVVLLRFSLYLAAMREYQVDECWNVYVARLWATGQAAAGVDLFQILLSKVMPNATCSADLFVSGRVFMLLIFWLNWILLAFATGARLKSSRWWLALIMAAAMIPFWDGGFEIRHDNLVLTGFLLAWTVVRFTPASPGTCFMLGSIAAALQLLSFNASIYSILLSLAVLFFSPPGGTASRGKLALAWALGVFGMLVLTRLAVGRVGLRDSFGAELDLWSGDSGYNHRIELGLLLGRLLGQAPLLLAALASALLSEAVNLVRWGKKALTWEGNLPEALLFSVATLALLAAPGRCSQQLLLLAPFAFLLAFRHAAVLWERVRDCPAIFPMIGALLIFNHLLPFGVGVERQLRRPMTDQEFVMSLAESVTDPVKDPVYDAIGLVPTRAIVDERALALKSNSRNSFRSPTPRVSDLLSAHPAVVCIASYRTDGLPEEERAFIRERYVPLSDDVCLLGKVLPVGGGAFEIFHPGRYRISSLQGSDLMGTYPTGWGGLHSPEDEGSLTGTLDGKAMSVGVVELTVGKHRIETTADCQPAVVWVGPRLDRIHRVSQHDHRLLFANWY